MGALSIDAVRAVRSSAKLTQTELAQRAGIPQSLVSAYETGRTDPSTGTLERLAAAAGFTLSFRLERAAAPAPEHPFTGPIGRRVQRSRQRIRDLLGEHGVTNPAVFGSVARSDDGPESDLDLLVDLPAEMGLFELTGLRGQLEAMLKARVDLVPRSGLRAHVAVEALKDEVPL